MNRVGQQLPTLGNSDSHIPFTVGQAFTWFPGHTSADLRRAMETYVVRPGGTTWKILDMLHKLYFLYGHRRSRYPARLDLQPVSNNDLTCSD